MITPTPVFQSSGLAPPSDSAHPLEDLLIEHPTMSIYRRHQPGSGDESNLNERHSDTVSELTNDQVQSEPGRGNVNLQQREEELRLRNQNNRELALRQNRQRRQLAAHMQIPPVQDRSPRRAVPPGAYGVKPSQLTRRALRKQNMNHLRHGHGGGKLHQGNRVQKCAFKAGRRRC